MGLVQILLSIYLYTRKHLVAVDEIKRILVLSRAREGKLHDKKFHDEDDIVGCIPDEIPIEVDPVIRAFYERLLAKGKVKKVAITACLHKMLTILNAMVRDDKSWQPPEEVVA